ncbi:MAG: hypothetical protein H0W86_00145 [Armatimonadetes bacterium]|nr:hypothetical protein [Armatimonadota bacterium]
MVTELLVIILGTLFLLIGAGCAEKKRGPEDALDVDPWYIPGNPNFIVPDRVTREEARSRLPYKLAVGQGEELKVEIMQIETDGPEWTSRVTNQLDNGKRYRTCQSEETTEGGPGSKFDPKVEYRGTEIWYSETGPYAWAEFDHDLLRAVEMCSQDLDSTELLGIAKVIVDNATEKGQKSK